MRTLMRSSTALVAVAGRVAVHHPFAVPSALAVALAAGAAAQPAAAQSTIYQWKSGIGFWSNANKWTPTGVPDRPGASILIENISSYEHYGISLGDNAYTVGNIAFNRPNGHIHFFMNGKIILDSGSSSDAQIISNGFVKNNIYNEITSSVELELKSNLSFKINGLENKFSVDGAISGPGSIIKNGEGLLELSGIVRHTGETSIRSGTLALSGQGSLSPSGAVLLSASGAVFDISRSISNQTIGALSGVSGTKVTLGGNTLIFGDADDTMFAGSISGSGGISKKGAGVVTLASANSFSGGVAIAGGTLALAHANALAAGNDVNLTAANATFDISGLSGGQVIGALSGVAGTTVNLGANDLTFGTSANTVFAGQFDGSGSHTKQGAGTVELGGDSSAFTGDLLVNNGALKITGRLGGEAGAIEGAGGDRARVEVKGPAAQWAMNYNLTVGGAGRGALLIRDGAIVSNVFANVASSSGDAATVTVSGQGSRWENGFALLAGVDRGRGEVHVLDGAVMTSVDGHIGSNANGPGEGLVEVSGAGSMWTNDGDLKIGNMNAQGTLRIADGGVVSNKISYIGSMSGGDGTVSVEGAGSRWNNSGDLNVGFGVFGSYGTGAVTIADGAAVTVGATGAGTVYLAKDGLLPGFGTTGTLSIGAASNNAADAIGAGTLHAGLVELGKGAATLRFNHTDNAYRFDTRLKGGGTGNIYQIAGTTVLTAYNADFKGKTTVSGGKLIVQDVLAGSAAVTGGVLQFGNGTTGAANSLSGDLNVSGSGATLAVTGPAALSVANTVDLAAETRLNIGAGATGPSLTADRLNIGSDVAFNLSGIDDEGQLPKVLISTANGISGDFASVTIGGFAGSVDYMTAHTGKSADGLSYQATYGLSWTGGNNLSHGAFTLTDASENFTLGVALRDQSPNAALGWDGRSLTKAGQGTLILTGDNIYTGGTTIQGGVLQIGKDGATGSVMGDIVNHGTLAFQRSDDFDFDGIVSGSGGLIKNGAGTLTLTRANSFTGGVTLTQGALRVASDVSLGDASGVLTFNGGVLETTDSFATARSILLGQQGVFDTAAGTQLHLKGAVSGAGSLLKRGAGTLRVDQASGVLITRVEAGMLIGNAASLSNTIANAATVVFDQNTDAAYTGVLMGLNNAFGRMEKRGAGALTLKGKSSLDWSINVGELITAVDLMGGDADIASGAAFRFNDAGDKTYSFAVSGAGRFVLDRDGATLLTGDSSTFMGVTMLNAGKLLVGDAAGGGRLGGSLGVLSGATLGGSGVVGSGAGSLVHIAAGGVLSPGASIGTLAINGDLTLAAGSMLNMELGAPGFSDRVSVSGDLSLDGTLNLSQSLSAADGAAGLGYYRLMTYGGALSGAGLTVGQTPTFNDPASFQIVTGNGNVDLFIAALGDDTLQHWQGGDGVWSASSPQWINKNGTATTTWSGQHAVFRHQPGGYTGGVITVDAAQAFKGLQFVDDGYRLEGPGALVTAAGGSEIRVLANSARIEASITGSGGLIVTQGGLLTLSGVNSYTGGTTLRGGVVAVSQNANLGHADGALRFDGGALRVTGTEFNGTDRTIGWSVAGGAFDITDADNRFEISADINGAGVLIKRGEGTLVLSGDNAFGGARIEGGGLIGTTSSLSGDIALISASSRLSLANANAGIFAGAFSGAGRVSLDGPGTVLLTGDSSGFSGVTTLNAGTLLVGNANGLGRLGGSLSVLSGATLGGSGVIGSGAGSHVSIASGGVLSPGNSIGTLIINGDLTFASGARFEVEVNPLGADSDIVRVTGAATLNGGTIAHIGATGRYDPRSTYTILSAASLTGAFDDVTSDFAFLNPKLHYDYGAGTVQMDLLRNDNEFASAAKTRNQAATANAIESIGFVAEHAVYDTVVQLADDADQIRASFDQLSGELHVSAQTAMIEDSRLIRNAANDRLRAAFGQTAASTAPVVAYASSGAPVAVASNHAGPAFWAQGFGSWGAFDGDDGGKTLDRDTSGVLLGGDALLNLWRVGVTGGYSQSNIKPRDRASSVSSDNYHLGVYAGTQHGALAFRTGLAQSWHDLDARRTIAIPGLSGRTRAEYRADALQAFGEVAFGLTAGDGARLEPFANLAHIRLKTDGFSESGGDAALTSEKVSADATFATLGLRAEQAFDLGETNAALRWTVGWRRASGATSPQSVHAFTAGDAFTITGAPISKDSAVLEGGLALSFTPATTMSLGYAGQVSNGAQDHAFTASFSLKF